MALLEQRTAHAARECFAIRYISQFQQLQECMPVFSVRVVYRRLSRPIPFCLRAALGHLPEMGGDAYPPGRSSLQLIHYLADRPKPCGLSHPAVLLSPSEVPLLM